MTAAAVAVAAAAVTYTLIFVDFFYFISFERVPFVELWPMARSVFLIL